MSDGQNPLPQVAPGRGMMAIAAPARPKVERPDTRDLMRRMRRVDPNQARRYRQRTGE